MPAAGAPYLSIVVTGRNDDLGGDFNGRFFRALRFNHAALAAAAVTHEFVFVEWRPIPGKPLLAHLLAEQFPELAGDVLVSYVIDPRYHDAVSLNPRVQFQEFIAKNVGVRRSRGSFVLTTNTDIYLGRGTVDTLARQDLRRQTLYRTVRIDLKSHTDVSHLTWDVLEDVRNQEIVNEIRPPCYTNASGDFLLLDRDAWHQVRGFNEIYRVAKIHLDGNFCYKCHASGLDLVDLGAPVYHVGAGTLHAMAPQYRERPDLAPWGDIRWKANVVYENPPGWGLGDAPVRGGPSGIHYVEFDWAAVPPMVDLRRVVLPPARTGRAEPA
jgi:hypothetical protein